MTDAEVIAQVEERLGSPDPGLRGIAEKFVSTAQRLKRSEAVGVACQAELDKLDQAWRTLQKRVGALTQASAAELTEDVHTIIRLAGADKTAAFDGFQSPRIAAEESLTRNALETLERRIRPAADRAVTVAEIERLECESAYHAAAADFLILVVAGQVNAAGLLDSSVRIDPEQGSTGAHRQEAARCAEGAANLRRTLEAGARRIT